MKPSLFMPMTIAATAVVSARRITRHRSAGKCAIQVMQARRHITEIDSSVQFVMKQVWATVAPLAALLIRE
jgi:hypothetical protein